MSIIRALAIGAFLVAVPVFLITTNVRWVINTPLLYSYGFNKYDIPDRTGIERDELLSAGRQIRDYFNNDEEFLDVSVVRGGVYVPSLYNTREILHMKDVKGLVTWVYRIQLITVLYLAGFVLVGIGLQRRRFLPNLARYVSLAGILTASLVVLVGLASLVGFDRLFTAFHLVSFSNDLWQLDLRRDFLIMMFPEGFFLDATIWIAGATIVEAVLLALVWWRPRMARRSVRALASRVQGTRV